MSQSFHHADDTTMPPLNRAQRRRLKALGGYPSDTKFPVWGLMAKGSPNPDIAVDQPIGEVVDLMMRNMRESFLEVGPDSCPRGLFYAPNGESLLVFGDPDEHDIYPSLAKVAAWTAAWAKKRRCDRFIVSVGCWSPSSELANDEKRRKAIAIIADDRQAGLTIKLAEVLHDEETDKVTGFNEGETLDPAIFHRLFANMLPPKSVGIDLLKKP